MGPILVTGGTGTLGRAVVRRLADEGQAVRVLSRRPAPAGTRYGWVTGDLDTGAGLAEAVAGVNAIVHCATGGGRGDEAATAKLVAAAHGAGDPHLVYISIVGIDRLPMFYYRAKLAAEQVVAESGLPFTILRATQFHDLIVSMFLAQRWLPATLALSGVSFQPVEVTEVAAQLAELATGEPAGRVPDMGGPQIRPMRDLAIAYLHAAGRSRPVLGLPVPGRFAAAMRRGANLTPDGAVGRVSFEQYLARRLGALPPAAESDR